MVYKQALIIHSCQFCLTLVGIVSNVPELPSPVNDPATVQQILQPLRGSGEQVAPPTTSSSQASLTSGTTASGDCVPKFFSGKRDGVECVERPDSDPRSSQF